MIQIRNVPDDIHRELKVRAAQAGMTLSDFLNAELARLAARRPLGDLVAEMSLGMSLQPGDAAAAVRAGRPD